MFYPNKIQWVIIWLSVLLAAHVWMGLDFGALVPGDRAWGLFAYLDSRLSYRANARLAVVILVIGALGVWMASRRHSGRH